MCSYIYLYIGWFAFDLMYVCMYVCMCIVGVNVCILLFLCVCTYVGRSGGVHDPTYIYIIVNVFTCVGFLTCVVLPLIMQLLV